MALGNEITTSFVFLIFNFLCFSQWQQGCIGWNDYNEAFRKVVVDSWYVCCMFFGWTLIVVAYMFSSILFIKFFLVVCVYEILSSTFDYLKVNKDCQCRSMWVYRYFCMQINLGFLSWFFR